MAITTYAELQTAMAAWSNRTDLTSYLPDFIMLAESRLYDMFILKNMETEGTLTLTIGVNYVALPSSYISPLAFWLVVNSEREKLDFAVPQDLPYYSSNGRPRYVAVDGDNLRFDCPADVAYSTRFRYIAKSNLSGSVTTNYLLARRPDIYLAGSLVELARFIKDDSLFNIWEPRFLSSTKELGAAENRNRRIAPMRVDAALAGGQGSGYDIFRGE